ncbi:MAG TPA: SurA N-terminal domain-containing protein, partial [Candidatus Limnocylindria bacterium]|nr:SurA N-terminal domain-containing protein [Candidatus Limnocylindria bacterium]
MEQHKKTVLKRTLAIVCGVIIIFAIVAVWLYSGSLTSFKMKTFQTLHLPMAFVGSSPIAMDDFVLRYNLTQTIQAKTKSLANDLQTKQKIYLQLINEAKTRQIAHRLGISVTQKQIDEDYANRSAQADLEGHKDYNELLLAYGLNESIVKAQIIKPALLTDNLQIWFNSQTNLNPKQYELANSLLQQIQAGKSMADLAKQFTQDPNGKSVAGDLGFVKAPSLLPEIREQID